MIHVYKAKKNIYEVIRGVIHVGYMTMTSLDDLFLLHTTVLQSCEKCVSLLDSTGCSALRS